MNKITKVFLLLMWLVALGGAGFGWWKVTHSDFSFLSLLKQASLMQQKGNRVEMDWSKATEVDLSDTTNSGMDISSKEETTVEPVDFSCVKEMQQMAQDTVEKYLLENGQPQEKVDLQTAYGKTPAKLRTKLGDGASCGAQYIYCDASSCNYSVYVMQKIGNFSTMAVSISGMLFAMNANHKWHISCFDMSDEGKQICDEYKNPPLTEQDSSEEM